MRFDEVSRAASNIGVRFAPPLPFHCHGESGSLRAGTFGGERRNILPANVLSLAQARAFQWLGLPCVCL